MHRGRRGGEQTGTAGGGGLSLANRELLVALYYRTNLTFRQVATHTEDCAELLNECDKQQNAGCAACFVHHCKKASAPAVKLSVVGWKLQPHGTEGQRW